MRRPRVSGPVIDIQLRAPNSTETVELQAVIDTGASVTCVDSWVARELGLRSADRKRMQMADGRETTAIGYLAWLQIEDLDFSGLQEVYAVQMAQRSRRMLLGRSFLRRYIVTYHGPQERFYYELCGPDELRYEDFDG